MAEEKKFHVGVKAFIQDGQGKVLLMEEYHKGNQGEEMRYWDFPGGRMQEGESVLQTLRREVEEETGITEFSEPGFHAATISNHEIKLKDGEIVGLVLMVYMVQIAAGSEIRLSDEHLGYEWVDMAETKLRLTHKYPQHFIDQL